MASTHSVSAVGGSTGGKPKRLACRAVAAPGQRTIRPPDSSSREASVWAMVTGLRSRTTCVQPSVMRCEARAKAVMAVTESRMSARVSEKNAIS